MMPRYIDADWLLDRAVPMGWSTPKWVSDILIKDAPTAEVVSKELYEQVKYERDVLQEIVDNSEQWIPVSERLPENEGWYLVTDDSGGVRWLDIEHYDPESGLEPFCTIQNPVAWMPLSEPWKGEEDAEVH